jgi:beta-lactamase regulating signal transducer with metallopeptidase domain
MDRLTDFLYVLGSVAFASAWQGTIMAILATAVLSRWRRVSAATRGACLWIVLFGTAAIPAWVALPIARATPESTRPQLQTVLVIRESIVTGPLTNPEASVDASPPFTRGRPPIARALVMSPTMVRTLAAMWFVTAIALLARLSIGVALVLSIKRRSLPAPPHINEMFLRLGGRSVGVRITDDFPVPSVIGYVRPVILLPRRTLQQLDASAMTHVLLHELAHVQRRDAWSALLLRLIRAVLFPLPGVHIIARRLEIDQELACDEWALNRSGSKPTDYVRSLLQVGDATIAARRSSHMLAPAAGTQLRCRIESLLDGDICPAPKHWWSRGAFAGVAFAGALIPLSAITPALTLIRLEVVSHAQEPISTPAALPVAQRLLPPDTLRSALDKTPNDSAYRPVNNTLSILIGELGAADAGARARAAFAVSAYRDRAAAASTALISLLGDDEPVARSEGAVSKAWSAADERDVTSPGEEAAKALLYIGRHALDPLTVKLVSLSGHARERAEWVAGLLRNYD